jgi:hypothetical protein
MALVVVLAAASTAQADAGYIFVADSGCYDGVCMTGLGMALPARRSVTHGDGWRVAQFWKPRIAYWHASRGHDLWDASIAPAFRLTSRSGFFAEAAVGAHLLSRTRIAGRELSTAFQFGEQLAAGFTFGRQREFTLAARAEHISNGGIRQPNDGITTVGLELQVGM